MNEKILDICNELLKKLRESERNYLKIVLAYFLFVLFIVFFVQKIYPHVYSFLLFRISVSLFVFASLFLHYYLKSTYFIKNKKSINLVLKLINENNIDLSILSISDIEKSLKGNSEFSDRDIKSILLNFKSIEVFSKAKNI